MESRDVLFKRPPGTLVMFSPGQLSVDRILSRVASSLWAFLNNIRPYTGSTQSPQHGFTSSAFVANHVTRPLPVRHFRQIFPSWRSTVFLKGLITLFYAGLLVIFYWNWGFSLIIHIIVAASSRGLIRLRIINQPFGVMSLASNVLEGMLYPYLIVISISTNVTGVRLIWDFFWTTYFLFCPSRHYFSQNYLEAWRLTYPTHVVTIFIDKINCIHVPCPDPHDMTDLWLLKHLSLFYRMSRIHGGIFQAILPTSLVQIEIVKLEQTFGEHTAGECSSILDLGNQIPGQIENSTFKRTIPQDQRHYIDDLVAKTVIRQATAAANTPEALNFVTKWDQFWLSVIILSPTIASITITVAWPVVAVLKYGADVQASVQTATSLASYIVTTGALLVGLVTLFEALAK
ncbi:hypothetical protein F5X98DRAFT_381772 [Xylaria grammica]|nr:hypothetical protein F5X98DRAFT_381772 [Xylaria grammica]